MKIQLQIKPVEIANNINTDDDGTAKKLQKVTMDCSICDDSIIEISHYCCPICDNSITEIQKQILDTCTLYNMTHTQIRHISSIMPSSVVNIQNMTRMKI